MSILKIFLSATLLMLAFSMSGCQGTNSDTPENNTTVSSGGSGTSGNGVVGIPPATNTLNTAIINLNPASSILSSNSQSVNITVNVYDSSYNAYTSGKIQGISPSDVLAGRDVGSFSQNLSEGVDVVNGKAVFTYTAPSNLETNTSDIVYRFYHDSNTSNLLTYTFHIVPDVNQTSSSGYVITTSDANNINMNLESTKSFLYSVVDDNGKAVLDANMTSLTVTSLDSTLVMLKDNSNNPATSSITVANNHEMNVNLISNTKSGLVAIKVDATFNTDNGEQNLSKIFNLVVYSGPPTAASIGFTGNNSFDATTGTYKDELRLFVTDKYSNPVNTNPAVALEMLTGYTTSSAATTNSAGYLYYESNAALSNNSGKGQLSITPSAFNNVDLANDFLVIFGTGYHFNTFGKWDIDTNTANVLNLANDFNASTTNSLSFAVGHNLRNETCGGHDAVVANIQPKNSSNILDDNGMLVFEIIHDDYMVGKSVIVASNFIGGHNNIQGQLGYAQKITLLGTGLESGTPIKVTQGTTTGIHQIRIYVKDSPTGRVYQNANFSAKYDVTANDTNVSVSGTSMDAGITDCSSGGAAYVEFTINGVAGGDGEISLSDLRIGSEF